MWNNYNFSLAYIIVHQHFGFTSTSMQSMPKYSSMGNQTIYFSMIIFYTCHLCLELKFLSLMNILNFQIVKRSLFPCNFFMLILFHQIHPMTMYLHIRKHVFFQNELKSIAIFYFIFLHSFHKKIVRWIIDLKLVKDSTGLFHNI